jgi:hypothetical protein
MVACVAAGEALGQRARLLVGGLHQTVADSAMLGAFTDCENIGYANAQRRHQLAALFRHIAA